MDLFSVEEKAREIILGRKSQIDVTMDLDAKVNQSILRYKEFAQQLNKGILNMENLANQVKYENQP